MNGITEEEHEEIVSDLLEKLKNLKGALAPLVAIANAYDENELDDEARKRWGPALEYECKTAPERLELYTGRGGTKLLTLADCLRAREALR